MNSEKKNAVDVIEMLEKCYSRDGCDGCPYENLDLESCSRSAVADAIVTLKRLREENESLKAQIQAAEQTIRAMTVADFCQKDNIFIYGNSSVTIKLREKEGSNS